MKMHGELSDSLLLQELTNRLEEKNKLLQSQSNFVAELTELNDRLRDSERMKSGFLSNIRNEINNPLTSILGLSAQIIQGQIIGADKITHAARLINKEAFSLDFQLRNIYSAAEIEAGEITPQLSMVNIDGLIQNQIQYFQLKAIEHNVTVSYQPTEGRHFKTDGAMLQSIVMNLLANAIEFSLEHTLVTINCQFMDGRLVLIVQNAGKGIAPQDRKHIFERFKQLDSGTTKTHHGHGLGLSIVQEFTDALQGKIEVDSELDRQTSVTVTLQEFSMDQGPEGLSSDGQETLFSDEEFL